MLQFAEGFFAGEERDGFYVDGTMKTVWAAELEVLAEIGRICEKYQLQWFADGGTLLGAVRHQGFIPWDDDIDICLKRPDYEKLMRVLREELPAGWQMRHAYHGNASQPQFWACVMNSNAISIEASRLSRFHGCPFVVGIDIFPLDYLPEDPQVAELEENLIQLIGGAVKLARMKDRAREDEETLDGMLRSIEEFSGVGIERAGTDEQLIGSLWTLANQIAMSYTEQDGSQLTQFIYHLQEGRYVFEAAWYEDVIYLPFETFELPVPIGYDGVLRSWYGDYMVKIRNTSTHEYPIYVNQIRSLRDIVKQMEEHAEREG